MIMKKERNNRKIIRSIFTSLLVFVMLFMNFVPISAITQSGKGGVAFKGATVNTFAAEMPLAEIYFDKNVFANKPLSITTTSDALIIDGNVIRLDDSKLSHNTADNGITGTYTLVYENAAILPDGTAKNVAVTMEIGRVLTVKSGDASIPSTPLIFRAKRTDMDGLNIVVDLGGGTGEDDTFFGMAVEQTMTITVDSKGDFVVPFYGVTQNRNDSNTYQMFRTNFPQNNLGYEAAIESVKVYEPDNVYIPTDATNYNEVENDVFIARGGKPQVYDPSGANGGSSGSDGIGYISGFAAFAKSGFKATINSPVSSNKSQSFNNNQYVCPGDLIHRIWSGSGLGGKISTYKNGSSGTPLDGGSFEDDIPDGMPVINTKKQALMRYVIPDAKAGVTYRMTPKKGYTLDKVVVDGETIEIQNNITIGQQWDLAPSTDGGGVLTYEGGGVFSYVFANPNTTDHSIYVTWKKATADIIVNKVWNDDSKASTVSAEINLISDAKESPVNDSIDVPLTSGKVCEWKSLPIYNFNEKGEATTAIKYTFSEINDPVSEDYGLAVWQGKDYENNAPDEGFTLTNPSLANGVREIGDHFIATVVNPLARSMQITKIWNDQNNKYQLRPDDITELFKIYNAADDTEFDKAIIDVEEVDENTYIITLSGLHIYDDLGNTITYYVKEKELENYKSDPADGIIQEGGTITNELTYTPKISDPEKPTRVNIPRTGD